MLVLSRKPLQSIMIGSDIKITVVKVDRNQVRIGIEAPQDVPILRDELIGVGDSSDREAVRFLAARV
jgi:carbon storage regulator